MTERELFVAALQQPHSGARFAFLAEACSDERMRVQVESMLQDHEQLGSFLESPASPATYTADSHRALEGPGTVVGPYRLLEQIGEGGMGVVYLAEQTHPVRRKVALKIIKPGMDTKQVIARFEAERQALAMMDHPNIAKVLDADATESGRPYFVMELVRGIPDHRVLRSRAAFHPSSGSNCSSWSAGRFSMPTRRGSSIAISSHRTSWLRSSTAPPCPRSSTSASPRRPVPRSPSRRFTPAFHQLIGTPLVHEPGAGGARGHGRGHPQRYLQPGCAARTSC